MLTRCMVIMASAMLRSPPRASAEETLVSPVFVLGVMKSGTTALYVAVTEDDNDRICMFASNGTHCIYSR